jgi:hypothetical protein
MSSGIRLCSSSSTFRTHLQEYAKRYPDNIGSYRRVLSFRKSADGVTWDGFSPPFLKDSQYWTPDEQDPVDLEFYRSVVFPTQGRYAMLLQDYIAPPPEANSRRQTTKHGPRSEAEWAISRDGLNWSRPYRDQDPTALVGALAVQGPLIRDGVMRFYERDRVIASIPEGRVFYVTGRGNCEFSTPRFQMPLKGITIDANLLYQVTEGPTGRSYLMQRCEAFFIVFSAAPSMCLLPWQGEKVADRPDEGFFAVSVVWKYFTALLSVWHRFGQEKW